MQETPQPRDCFVLVRGQYDKPGEKVTASLPAALPPLPNGAPNNRLGVAKWLIDPSHPLTARVQVNRFWEMFFGVGIVKSSENFGMQSTFPSHPELLDWLATEYIRLGWDTKAMLKTILMSATYRQSSNITPELMARDPENRLLARGPRFRLQAELVRDNALAISGLLVEKVGGPPVRPYQPEGIWDEINVYGNLRNYKHDQRSRPVSSKHVYDLEADQRTPQTCSSSICPAAKCVSSVAREPIRRFKLSRYSTK